MTGLVGGPLLVGGLEPGPPGLPLNPALIEPQDCLVIECVRGRPQNSTVEGIIQQYQQLWGLEELINSSFSFDGSSFLAACRLLSAI